MALSATAAVDPEPDRYGRLRLFAGAADEPRARRVTDAALLAVSLVLLVTLGLAEHPAPGFVRALFALLEAVPSFLDVVWLVTVNLLGLLAVVLAVVAALRARWSVVRDLVVAALIAAAVGSATARVVTGSWGSLWPPLSSSTPWFPAERVAIPAAVLITVSPHLIRPLRRLHQWLIAIAAVGAVLLGAATPLGAVAAVLVATIAATAVRLVFGTSAGRPSLHLVAEALGELGVATEGLGVADRQETGSFHVDAVDANGRRLLVKVYGRDAHDASLLTTAWRAIWYRDASAPLRFGRRNQVEHEAFLTLFARQAGVVTDEVVAAGTTSDDDALIVLRRAGGGVASDGAGLDGAEVTALWAVVGRLHGAGIAHGQVDTDHIVRVGGEVGLVDFGGGGAAPTPLQRRTDEVQALVTVALACGSDVAVSTARGALGDAGVARLLPYLQPSLLTRLQRRLLRDHLDLDELRAATASAVGVDEPELEQLRRITVGSVLRVLLPALALIVVISLATGFDWSQLPELLADASWWLVVLGVLVGQTPRFTGALSTLGASPVPLPLGPVYALQLATSYINLAIPSTAARVAMNIRFFQRHGVAPGTAVATGALDGFASFLTQVGLLTVVLVFTGASLDLDFRSALDNAARLLGVVVVLVAIVLVVVFAVRAVRRRVVAFVRRVGGEAIVAVRGLQSPRRLVLLFGGSLATEVLFAVTLGIFCQALGARVGLGELLLVNIGVSLLAGLLPVPGGVGITEGGLTFGLVSVGVPEEIAFAAVLLQRAATFYLPPLWGWFAMRWLQRKGHL